MLWGGLAALCLVPWYRGALFGIAALFCVAGVSVVASVNSFILARVLHLAFQLFHCLSARSILEEQPWLSVIDLTPRGEDRMW